MTTNGTESTTRTISQLLALETYQGMTDTEIETIINYKAERIANAEIHSEHMRIQQENADKKLVVLRNACYKSNAMLESILNRDVVLNSTEGSNG